MTATAGKGNAVIMLLYLLLQTQNIPFNARTNIYTPRRCQWFSEVMSVCVCVYQKYFENTIQYAYEFNVAFV